MKLSATALIPRRAFLALGLAAGSACLAACSGKDSKGSYDDGYAAGYAAAQADAAGKRAAATGITISQYQVLSTPSQGRSAGRELW